MSYLLDAYTSLKKVYSDNKYLTDVVSSISDSNDKALITRIVYGVVERDVTLEYILSKLVTKSPKSQVKLILKIGLYCLKYMDSLPDYSVCDNCVKLTKQIGKSSLAGFVNATLKASITKDIPLPENTLERLSVTTSTPLWIVKKVVKQYGDRATTILNYTPTTLTHIRRNSLRFDKLDFEREFSDSLSDVGGAFVKVDGKVKELFSDGKITFQSPESMKIVSLCIKKDSGKILDVCSAPGGKSVYLAELTASKVTAFDLHPHRVELIKKYASRMGVDVDARVQDGTVFVPSYSEIFDIVLVDAPCSGIGVRYSKPDVLLNRQEKDIVELNAIQQSLLDNSCRYVKTGGVLVYSTCTIFEEENERVVTRFLSSHPEFRVDSEYMKVTPGVNGQEGFFAVRLRRVI